MPDTGIQVKAASILSRWEKLSNDEEKLEKQEKNELSDPKKK
jgi:hypothetical protein